MSTNYMYQVICSYLTEKEEYALDVLCDVMGFNEDTFDSFIYAVFGNADVEQWFEENGYC